MAQVGEKDGAATKAIVIIHGLNDSPSTLEFFASHLRENLPGTAVYLIHILHGLPSHLPLWYQVERFRTQLDPIRKQHPEGIHLIGYSQGGLIARALVETDPDHGVHTFISLTAPQQGQFGETMLEKFFFYKPLMKVISWICYTRAAQLLSLFNFWRDPRRIPDYLRSCKFLPLLNNEVSHPRSAAFKVNFLKLERLVLIGGPNDTTITPWQSSHFGYIDAQKTIEDMTTQKVFVDDTFGLRTLKERGALTVLTVPGIDHQEWPDNVAAIDEFILPWLR